jgi:acetyltransferase-like isoleucine patch superfamily enzyme
VPKKARTFIWKARRRLMAAIMRAANPAATFGDGVLVEGFRPRICALGEFRAGRGLYFRAPTRAAEINVGERASLTIGDSVLLNDGVHIEARLRVDIGSHCKIAHNVAIMDTNFHQVDEGEEIHCAEVVIEDNVWIGRGAIVLPGVTIGRNSVIAAGAVVTRDIPPNSLATGNPATVKRPVSASASFVRK